MSSVCFRAEKAGWMAVLKIRSGPNVERKNQILLQFPWVLNHIMKEPWIIILTYCGYGIVIMLLYIQYSFVKVKLRHFDSKPTQLLDVLEYQP